MRIRLVGLVLRTFVTIECGYCGRGFTLSTAQLNARLERYHLVKCRHCGATLEEPIEDRRIVT